jgi:hypothetical protein
VPGSGRNGWRRPASAPLHLAEEPWPNGLNESLDGRFWDECLNRELIGSVLESQVIARAFREEHNAERPNP